MLAIIYIQETNKKFSECLKALTANFSVDGWLNVHNKSILCADVTTKKGKNYLVDKNDKQSHLLHFIFYPVNPEQYQAIYLVQ